VVDLERTSKSINFRITGSSWRSILSGVVDRSGHTRWSPCGVSSRRRHAHRGVQRRTVVIRAQPTSSAAHPQAPSPRHAGRPSTRRGRAAAVVHCVDPPRQTPGRAARVASRPPGARLRQSHRPHRGGFTTRLTAKQSSKASTSCNNRSERTGRSRLPQPLRRDPRDRRAWSASGAVRPAPPRAATGVGGLGSSGLSMCRFGCMRQCFAPRIRIWKFVS